MTGSGKKMTLTKADLVERVFEDVGLNKKEATDVVELVFDSVKETLQRGDKVKVSGFGNFSVHGKNSRLGRNPQTGEEMTITARSVVKFKPSQVLKAILNKNLNGRGSGSGAEHSQVGS